MNHSLRRQVQILRDRTVVTDTVYIRDDGNSRRSGGIFHYLELGAGVQPALVLVEALLVPDSLVDSLEYPSATGLSTLK